MKLLGVVSDQTFKDTATQSKAAYDAMKTSGTSSARELADGFKKMAADQIAASGEVGSTQRAVTQEILKAEGAMRGLSVAFEVNGQMVIKTQADAAAAIDRTTGNLGHQREALDAVTSALEQQNAVRERAIASKEKENQLTERTNALERERLNIDKEGFALNTAGERVQMKGETSRSVYENAKSQGLSESQALQISSQFIQNGQQTGYGGANASIGENWYTELQKAIDKLVLANAANNTSQNNTSQQTQTNQTMMSKAYTVNLNIAGVNTPVNVASDADAQALITALQRAKLSA
jgi:hypothetical protein